MNVPKTDNVEQLSLYLFAINICFLVKYLEIYLLYFYFLLSYFENSFCILAASFLLDVLFVNISSQVYDLSFFSLQSADIILRNYTSSLCSFMDHVLFLSKKSLPNFRSDIFLNTSSCNFIICTYR